jgi:hypothetical protein
MKKSLAMVLVIACTVVLTSPAHAGAKSVTGSNGATLTASATSVKAGAALTVTGNHFDETVGIYIAFCVVPKKGKAPTPCGGGVDKAGTEEASLWISSNPPPYGIGLAEEFLPGGRFTKKIKISRMIGKFDCRRVKCAVTVRADHMRSNDRSFDIFIPITIK